MAIPPTPKYSPNWADCGKACNGKIVTESRWPVALVVALVNGIAGALPACPWPSGVWRYITLRTSKEVATSVWLLSDACRHHRFSSWLLESVFGRDGADFQVTPTVRGIALVALSGLIALGGGIAYATADHPRAPSIGGKQLALEIELRVPANGRTIEQLQAVGFAARVDADRDYAPDSSLLWSRAVRTDEFITVPMWAALHSETNTREIANWDAHESWHTFKVTVPASPQKIDELWSDWIVRVSPAIDNDQRQVPECHARYRVRFAADRPDVN